MKSKVILNNAAGVINDCITFNESNDLELRAGLYDLIEKRLEILENLGVDYHVEYQRDKDDAITFTGIVVTFNGVKVVIEI